MHAGPPPAPAGLRPPPPAFPTAIGAAGAGGEGLIESLEILIAQLRHVGPLFPEEATRTVGQWRSYLEEISPGLSRERYEMAAALLDRATALAYSFTLL